MASNIELIRALAQLRPLATYEIHPEATTLGEVVWRDERPMPTQAEVDAVLVVAWYERGLERMRAYRTPLLDALSGIAGRLARANQPEDAAAADAAAQALLDLPQWLEALPGSVTLNGIIIPVPAPIDDESFDDACLARYREIAAACPPSVQSAFREAV